VRQFDVCLNPSPNSRRYAPYVVVLQSHLLEAMPTVIVAPMLEREGRQPYRPVSAIVSFEARDYIVSVAELSAIDPQGLKAAGNLLNYEFEIRRAIDGVFTGF
jgi:toxin CcdB